MNNGLRIARPSYVSMSDAEWNALSASRQQALISEGKWSPLIIVLLFAMPCFSQGQDKVPIPPNDTSVEWVDIRVPKFPPLARQARIFGTVAVEVHFKGCALDPASPNVVSGHPMLAPAAVESLKQSTFRCGDGDFPDSNATLYYEFGEYPGTTCGDSRNPRVEVAGSHIRVLATVPCWEP